MYKRVVEDGRERRFFTCDLLRVDYCGELRDGGEAFLASGRVINKVKHFAGLSIIKRP